MRNSTRQNGPYRSRNGMIAGVCSGIAEHYAISTFWVRLGTVALFFIPAVGSSLVPILYIIAMILMKPAPVNPLQSEREGEFYDAYVRSPKYTIHHIHEKFQNLDRRIQRMEDTVTNRSYDWDQKLNGFHQE